MLAYVDIHDVCMKLSPGFYKHNLSSFPSKNITIFKHLSLIYLYSILSTFSLQGNRQQTISVICYHPILLPFKSHSIVAAFKQSSPHPNLMTCCIRLGSLAVPVIKVNHGWVFCVLLCIRQPLQSSL